MVSAGACSLLAPAYRHSRRLLIRRLIATCLYDFYSLRLSFLAICGPPRYSEIRLNLAQAVQGIGSFVAPLLASRVFFANTVNNARGLKNVQWTYLGVACFVALLIVLFFLAPMPEITDADMGIQEIEIAEYDPGPLRKQYNLFLGVWSQFCYVGAQVAVAGYFINFAEEAGRSPSQACKAVSPMPVDPNSSRY